ncbi:hypothetical protein V6N12_049458 [Hibiscus sabdariffa]|uniref:Uncharacterized protein n=1 Tax=Hibiscus sabdariffa TaxID=183260 RepID=A0ABR2CBD6_9ROSI
MRPKYSNEWIKIEAPLVLKLPNSTHRWWPGTWKSSPGVRRTKRTNDTKIGPQSDMVLETQKHTNEPKIQQRVDEDGSTTGLKVAELDASMVAGNLEQQPRRQQHEKNQRHKNRTPIQHRFRR